MRAKRNRIMYYNGLKNDLNSFAKFIFIYETEIKYISGLPEFSYKFAKSYNTFLKNKKKLKIKYATIKEIKDLTDNQKYTLHMTKQKFQIWDLCRHIRNSIVHALVFIDKDKLLITDKHCGRLTTTGYLSYKHVKEFIVEIINEYENYN